MKGTTLASALIVLSTISIAQGCHGKPSPPTDNENKDAVVRRKRSVRPPADARVDMSDFFTQCMTKKSKPDLIPQMKTLVDSVLRDSDWYDIIDRANCRDEKDTRDCWNNEADGLIDWTSELLGPLRECILEYSSNITTGGFRKKRQADNWSRFDRSKPTSLRPEPPCPQVTDDMYGSCMEEQLGGNSTSEYPSLENFHWESIAIFLRHHYSRCRYVETVEAWNNNRIVYRKTCPPYRYRTTSGDPAQFASQQCVPFLLQEYIKEESPLNVPSEECNERFANVTFIDEEVESFVENALTPAEELRQYGPRGRHNGADIVGYCDPSGTFTPWFDNFTADGTGDSELLQDIPELDLDLNICDQPSGIQMRVARNDEPWYTAGNNLKVMSPRQGLQCLNSMQHNKPCENFKVRYCCSPNRQPTNQQKNVQSQPRYRKTANTIGTCGVNDRWGYWMNIDTSANNGGDFEVFQGYGMPNCDPVAVQGRIRGSNRPYSQAYNNLSTEDPKVGIVCRDENQPKERPCRDFEVRFCCKNGAGVVVTTHRPVLTTIATTFVPKPVIIPR